MAYTDLVADSISTARPSTLKFYLTHLQLCQQSIPLNYPPPGRSSASSHPTHELRIFSYVRERGFNSSSYPVQGNKAIT